MHVKLELDRQEWDRLVKLALREKRRPDWQAEVLLRRALGLPFPPEPELTAETQPEDAPQLAGEGGAA